MNIGVTGNIASGKSTVCGLLRDKIGAAVVDADGLGNYLRETNPDIQRLLRLEFGSDIMEDDGRRISRKRLGRLVFSSPENLTRLNRIFFPYITYAVKMEVLKAQKMFQHIIIDAALILEWGMQKDLDKLVVVTADYEVRLDRLSTKRRMLVDEAAERLNSQGGEEYKVQHADVIVKNNGTLEELDQAVDRAILQLGLAPESGAGDLKEA